MIINNLVNKSCISTKKFLSQEQESYQKLLIYFNIKLQNLKINSIYNLSKDDFFKKIGKYKITLKF